MSFLAGDRLWLLLVVLAIAVAYIILAARRNRYAVRFADLDLLASVAPTRPGWRRHVSAAAFLIVLTSATVAFARPVETMRVSSDQAAVVVALDVSNSMSAVDVAPTRIAAAKAGATQFVEQLPAGLKVGLVAFYGTAREVAAPTTDHPAVVSAIQTLSLGPGTAIGDAVETSLEAVGAQAGGSVPARVVLLSDGGNTVGEGVEQAAAHAKADRVPVSTIAYGTPDGVVTIQGQTIPVPADVSALKALADDSGGRPYTAQTLGQLRAVYSDIGAKFVSTPEVTEIGARFVGIALLAGLVCAVAALLWSPRLP